RVREVRQAAARVVSDDAVQLDPPAVLVVAGSKVRNGSHGAAAEADVAASADQREDANLERLVVLFRRFGLGVPGRCCDEHPDRGKEAEAHLCCLGPTIWTATSVAKTPHGRAEEVGARRSGQPDPTARPSPLLGWPWRSAILALRSPRDNIPGAPL